MDRPMYIEKDRNLEKAQDFKFLRNEGIKRIQELTGSYWTDYNLHDPGVTILEQLCYAITDLSYRTSVDIEKHIFSDNQGDVPFFKPEDILTNGPITINDFRKVFIDTIPEIRNIWIEPAPVSSCIFNGLYNIRVDLSHQQLQGYLSEEDLRKSILKAFSKYRNLGEDVFEIEILKEIPIKLFTDIETDGLHDLEKILAQIYYCVEQSLAPEVKFYSMQELIDKGMSYNAIFNGPRLKNGFILDEDLQPKKQYVAIADIVRDIMQIEGVTSVKQMQIEVDGIKHNSMVNIGANQIPRVINHELRNTNIGTQRSIRFFRGNLEYSSLNSEAFLRYLNELISANKKNYRISEVSFEKPKDISNEGFEHYYSIQNHFPALYGIGPDGLSGRFGPERKAQANQLKGYLLLFEQVLANYLSQLANFKELLSIHKKQNQTYYTQLLNTIPNANHLFIKQEGMLNDAYLNLEHIPANYKQGLPALNKLFDNYIDRRNRFLDYLLALHGEEFTHYSLQQFNPYYSTGQFENFVVLCKTAMLQDIANMNYNRSQGLDYFNKTNTNYSALVKRIAIIMGMGIQETETGKIEVQLPDSYFSMLRQHKMSLLSTDASAFYKKWSTINGIKQLNINEEDIRTKFDIIDDSDIDKLDIKDSEKKVILESLWPLQNKKVIKEFLSDSIILDNYRIGKKTDKGGDYLLVFKPDELNDFIIMGKYTSEADAQKAVKVLINEFREINIKSEGVTLIEHILLRPAPEEEMFGIYINGSDGKHILKSNQRFSLSQRDQILNIIEDSFSQEKSFYVEADENREMSIVFKIENTDLIFSSIQPNISVEYTHAQREALIEFLSKLKKEEISRSEVFGFYVQYEPGRIDIPEEFFSFQLSLIFPDWTARFQGNEFKEIINDIIIEQKPANISANVGWFKSTDMKKLEKYLAHFSQSLQTQTGKKDYSGYSDFVELLYLNCYKQQ